MYKRGFFVVVFALMVMGVVVAGSQVISAIPGINGLPSSYDPKITVQEAIKSSDKPLLVEFYTDACATCKAITPWVYNLHDKYRNKLNFVMVNANDPQQSQVTQIFGIEYVPAIFVFDFAHMAKAQVNPDNYTTPADLDKGIAGALNTVAHAPAPMMRRPMAT